MLHDRVALVTGASAGIGFAICRELCARGARVAMVARTQAKLEAAVAALGGHDRALAFPLDVGELQALKGLPERVVKRCGRLDWVVNNAGVHHRGLVAAKSPAELITMVNVNLSAPIVLSRAALPFLPAGGAIINVASLAGLVPVAGAATYSASKAGLRAFSRALAEETRPSGITVHTVSPGPVDTDFFLAELDDVAPITFSQPMSTPEDVARAVLRCVLMGQQEIAVPRWSGKLSTLGYLSPTIYGWLRPFLEKLGAKHKAAYAARRRASASIQ